MGNNMYNILWIDDEWDKMTTFQQECEEIYHLHLVPFRTRKDGIGALERDIEKWDAVLLDAKMFDEGENEVAKLTGLRKAKQRLDELSLKKAIPYFISTGQADLISDENFEDSFGKYYVKGKDDVKLLTDIMNAIDNSPKQQIEVLYQDVFSAMDLISIRQYAEEILMDIFLPMHYPAKDPNFRPVHHFNQLRQLLEYVFRACKEVGLVPDQCIIDGKVNLNQCSVYLAGKDAEIAGIRYGEKGDRIVPEYIESIIRSILEFGNIHSHTVELNEDDLQKLENIFKSAKSRFVIFGLALQICEVVMWFAEYILKHKNKERNLAMCNELPKIENEVIQKYQDKEFTPKQDENGIWHCDECYVKISSWDNGKMKLTTVSPNTDIKTKDRYPYFARFKKILVG